MCIRDRLIILSYPPGPIFRCQCPKIFSKILCRNNCVVVICIWITLIKTSWLSKLKVRRRADYPSLQKDLVANNSRNDGLPHGIRLMTKKVQTYYWEEYMHCKAWNKLLNRCRWEQLLNVYRTIMLVLPEFCCYEDPMRTIRNKHHKVE